MHAAPAVEVTVGRDRPARGMVAVLSGAAAASATAWGLQLFGLPAVAGAFTAAGAAAAAAWWRCAGRPGVLRWDGRTWCLLDAAAPAPVEGRVTVAIDLEAWLLLRFDGDAGRRWLPLSRATHVGLWHALRCALYARTAGADTTATSDAGMR